MSPEEDCLTRALVKSAILNNYWDYWVSCNSCDLPQFQSALRFSNNDRGKKTNNEFFFFIITDKRGFFYLGTFWEIFDIFYFLKYKKCFFFFGQICYGGHYWAKDYIEWVWNGYGYFFDDQLISDIFNFCVFLPIMVILGI